MDTANYIKALENQDWYYDYSDDYRVYSKGSAAKEKLVTLANQLDPDRSLWNAHAPDQFKIKRPQVAV